MHICVDTFLLHPFHAQSLWIFSLVNYEPPTYHNGQYEYPTWAHGLGWSITAVSLVCIPAYGIVTIVRADGETWFEVLLQPLPIGLSLTH